MVALNKTNLANYIDGEWVEGERLTAVFNPATGEDIVKVTLSSSKEVDLAVKAAERAQKEWSFVPAPKRTEVLYKVGSLLKEQKERLSRLLTMENGKVIDEAR